MARDFHAFACCGFVQVKNYFVKSHEGDLIVCARYLTIGVPILLGDIIASRSISVELIAEIRAEAAPITGKRGGEKRRWMSNK